MAVALIIDITVEQRKTVLALLDKHLPNTAAWAFGSRAKWTARPQSDLDLVVFTTTEQRGKVSDLREAFEESNLPFRVDLFVWDDVPENFRGQIEAGHVVLVDKEVLSPRTLRNLAMEAEWRKTTLGEVVTLQRGFDLPATERKFGSYPIIASTGIVGTHNRAVVQGPGVVIGRSGSLGGGQYIEHDFWPLNTTLWVKDFKNNDPRFCYFLLKSLDLGQFNAGSGVPTLNRNHIHPLPLKIPSLPTQRAIAHILGTLDDKIELNHRMNETLEAMARALFKSWFVDFDPVHAKSAIRNHDAQIPMQQGSIWSVERARAYLERMAPAIADLFPSQLVDSDLGEIPEGWVVDTLGKHFNLTMGQSPPGSTYNEKEEGLPFFQGKTDFGFRYPVNRIFCSEPSRIAHADDTLISVRAPVGEINMALEKCCVGRGVAAIRHKSGSSAYTYYALNSLQPEIQQYEHTGTVFGSITKKQFEVIQTLDHPADLVDMFETCTSSQDRYIRNSTKEIRTMTAIRDVLIPNLISGKLRVKQIEELCTASVSMSRSPQSREFDDA